MIDIAPIKGKRPRVVLPPYLRGLSDDAKAVGAAWFSMMHPGSVPHDGGLHFGMKVSKPTARAQSALDELVAKSLITREPDHRGPGVRYKPCVTFERLFPWMWLRRDNPKFRFALTEPIDAALAEGER